MKSLVLSQTEEKTDSSTKTYKNIIFDLGRVLVHWHFPSIVGAIQERDPSIPDRICDVTRLACWRDFDRGRVTKEQVIQLAKPYFLPEHTLAFIEEALVRLTAIEEGVALLNAVREKGYNVYILSNMPREFLVSCRKAYNDFKDFHGAIFSCDVGANKPEPIIYKALLEKFSIDPFESLFIDDLRANLEAGLDHGIDGVLCECHKEAREGLVALGII